MAVIVQFQMSQRHYSPDQLISSPQPDSPSKSKRMREGGSTSKLLASASRFREDEVCIGDYRYRVADEIGAGYSSRVYRATGKDKQDYAVKVIEMRRFSASGLEMMENEIEILKALTHPNIIRLYHVHRTQAHTYLVTELCREGDLLEYMARRGRLSEEAASTVMADVFEGVKHLMKVGIIHRDLKPANILRSERTWKIADFGFSIYGKEEVRTRQNVGTPLYMPIESLLKNIYSAQSDIFALGVMYYQLLVGATPWECRSEKQLIRKLATVPFTVPEKYKLSAHIKFLLHKMCAVDKTARMQKEEFNELNLKNFVSLHHFNDPSSTKKIDEAPKRTTQSPSSKVRRSKSKTRAGSKEGNKEGKGKTEREYKLGRRKRSVEKKKSVEKEVVSTKTYGVKGEEAQAVGVASELQVPDRFEIINEKVLLGQLDYCRFLYYLVQNSNYLPLAEDSLARIVLVAFKQLLKLAKQLGDGRQNWFKLPQWDTFRQSPRWATLLSTFQEYCQKYEKEYLRHIKEVNGTVIKEVNQKFSELASNQPLSLSFYRKLQSLVLPTLKECLLSTVLGEEKSQAKRGYFQGVRSLLQYYRWTELNVKHFQNYGMHRNTGILIVKNYKHTDLTAADFAKLAEQICALS